MEVENALNMSNKAKLLKMYSVTGLSFFYRWYSLCGFDPVNDLVIDPMHVVLNMTKNKLELLLGRGQEQPVINQLELADALRCLWTPELRNGCVPTLTASSDQLHLGNRKTEEFIKFVKVSPFVLHSLIPKTNYDCFLLLHRIC